MRVFSEGRQLVPRLRESTTKAQSQGAAKKVLSMNTFNLPGTILPTRLASVVGGGRRRNQLGAARAAIPPWSVIGSAGGTDDARLRKATAVREAVRGFGRRGACAGIIVILDPSCMDLICNCSRFCLNFKDGTWVCACFSGWSPRRAALRPWAALALCVHFQHGAQVFYRRFGFEAVAVLDKLASDASDELLMRKRLSYGASRGDFYCTSRTMRPRTFPSMIAGRGLPPLSNYAVRHAGKLVRIEVSGEPRPCLEAFRFRGHDGIDAGESYGAKDKGRDALSAGPSLGPNRKRRPLRRISSARSTFASVWLPTASTPPAQRSRPSGFPGVESSAARSIGSPKRAEIGLFLESAPLRR